MEVYTVLISHTARHDLRDIHDRVAPESPQGDLHLIHSLIEAAGSLEHFPLRHPRVRRRFGGESVRSATVLNHRILYTVEGLRVNVIRFVHGSRRLPRRLGS